MSDEKTNLLKVFTSIKTYLNLYENSEWVKTANTEQIKSAFKLAHFIEKAIDNFDSNISEFITSFNNWHCNCYEENVYYDEETCLLACDNILKIFFKNEYINETTLETAVRIYTSLFSKERFEAFLSKMILLSTSFEVIADIVLTEDLIKKSELEFRLKLQNLGCNIENGNFLHNEIDKLLNNIQEIYLVFGMLSLNEVSVLEQSVQIIVHKILLNKMLDRSILSKKFWVAIFKQTDFILILETCKKYDSILLSFFNFIVFIGTMMELNEGNIWKCDLNTSVCPEIQYEDVLNFIKIIANEHTFKNFVIKRLYEAKRLTNSEIWDVILKEL